VDAKQWVMLAVVAIIVAIVGYRWFSQSRARTEQDRRISVQAQDQAHLPGDWISQREDRRLAGMSAEDQAWEQASLQRHHASQDPTRQAEVSP
jgi:hypothetical protein